MTVIYIVLFINYLRNVFSVQETEVDNELNYQDLSIQADECSIQNLKTQRNNSVSQSADQCLPEIPAAIASLSEPPVSPAQTTNPVINIFLLGGGDIGAVPGFLKSIIEACILPKESNNDYWVQKGELRSHPEIT